MRETGAVGPSHLPASIAAGQPRPVDAAAAPRRRRAAGGSNPSCNRHVGPTTSPHRRLPAFGWPFGADDTNTSPHSFRSGRVFGYGGACAQRRPRKKVSPGDTARAREPPRARRGPHVPRAPATRALEQCAHDVERRRVPGDVIEAGIALGGSAVVLATLMGGGPPFHGYDVFGMIPPPARTIPGVARALCGDRVGPLPVALPVPSTTATSPTSTSTWLRRSLVTTSSRRSPHRIPPRPFRGDAASWARGCARAHRQRLVRPGADLPDADRTPPVPGGYIVLDDYCDYGGCRRAVDEFLASEPAFSIVGSSGSVTVQRLSTG